MKKVWNATKKLLGEYLTSKKAMAAIVVVLAWIIGRLGLDIDAKELAEELAIPIGTILVYILGQGVADFGKEAKKIEVSAVDAEVDKVLAATVKDPPQS